MSRGAWVIYDYGHGPYAIALHDTCEEAVRAHDQGRIAFWPFGTEFGEAIKEWEAQR